MRLFWKKRKTNLCMNLRRNVKERGKNALLQLLDNLYFLLTNVSGVRKFICPNGYIKKINMFTL